MREYIDKTRLMQRINTGMTLIETMQEIIDAPAADVVEVVRCRECKHSIMHKFPYNYEKVLACNDPHGVTIRAVKPMHFCSYGERKDGGQEPPKEEE